MRVWVYPEKQYAELGATRFEIQWEQIRKESLWKLGTDNDIDPDSDISHRCLAFKTIEAARKKARAIVDAYNTAYGQVTITKQIVDWYVEEDHIAEWSDTNEIEYID